MPHSRPSRYGAILLAAGLSSRFLDGDKLVHPWRGRPLMMWAVETLSKAPVVARVAVIGPQDGRKAEWLAKAEVSCVVNTRPADGMGSSLALGARALGDELEGVFVLLADMPLIPSGVFLDLVMALEARPECSIAAPVYEGQRGHPVLFGAEHVESLRRLRGDEGARAILQQARAATYFLPTVEPGVLRDFDTVEAFAG